ncbi:unnamed protein product [Umbelopsis vinacea]
MTDQLKSVCEQLDNLAIQYIEEADAISKLKQNIGNEMAKGFFNLGHAKYTMGTNKLSRYSYDERMKSLYKIKVNEQRDNRNDVFSITNVEFDDESKANENLSDTAKDEVTEQLNKLTLRQRTAAQANADRTVPEMLKENEKDESATNTEKRASKKRTEKRPIDRNPLHWFGILVPASLRTCQQHFKNAALYTLEEANHLNRLTVLEEQYQALQKRKAQILNDLSSLRAKDDLKPGLKPQQQLAQSENNERESESESENHDDQVVPETDVLDAT